MVNTDSLGDLKRRTLREQLASGKLLRHTSVHSALMAKLTEDLGFDGIHISGAALSYDLNLMGVGLSTLRDVSERAEQIAAASSLPAMADCDTGLCDASSAARLVRTFEDLGFAGCHLDDGLSAVLGGGPEPDAVLTCHQMIRRLRAAVAARRDPAFMICARTRALKGEGLDATIDRANSYVDEGADAMLPDSLADTRELATFRRWVNVPLIATVNDLGPPALLDTKTLKNAGVSLVIYTFAAVADGVGKGAVP